MTLQEPDSQPQDSPPALEPDVEQQTSIAPVTSTKKRRGRPPKRKDSTASSEQNQEPGKQEEKRLRSKEQKAQQDDMTKVASSPSEDTLQDGTSEREEIVVAQENNDANKRVKRSTPETEDGSPFKLFKTEDVTTPSGTTTATATPTPGKKRGRPRIHPRPGEEGYTPSASGRSRKRKRANEPDQVDSTDKESKENKDSESVVNEENVEGAETASSVQTPVATIEEPEADVEEIEGLLDEAGETKITKDGELLGGRKWKVPAFQLPSRGERWYMLSMDPAKVLGFRDSYLFFLRNPNLKRIWATDVEKNVLIERGLLMPNFRTRGIAIVTARSIFKHFGFRIIKNGRQRRDDYYEAAAGPEDIGGEDDSDGEGNGMGYGNGDYLDSIGFDRANSSANRRRQESGPGVLGISFSSSASRHAAAVASRNAHLASVNGFGSSGLGGPLLPKKDINQVNWMHQTALYVRDFNTRLREGREARSRRFFDVHTGVEQVPRATQPTWCDIEVVNGNRLGFDHAGGATVVDTLTFTEGPRDRIPVIKDDGSLDHEVIDLLPPEIKTIVRNEVDTQVNGKREQKDDDGFPLALMDGQYQSNFAIHQNRFNQVLPRLQSAHAVPYQPYLSTSGAAMSHTQSSSYPTVQQMGSGVNPMYSDSNTLSSMAAYYTQGGSTSQMLTPQQMIALAQSQGGQYAYLNKPVPPQPTCGVLTHKNKACKRIVAFVGDRCMFHKGLDILGQPVGNANYSNMANTTSNGTNLGQAIPSGTPVKKVFVAVREEIGKGFNIVLRMNNPNVPPTPVPAISTAISTEDNNKCAYCHYLSAPQETIPSEGTPCSVITMTPCTKCQQKYHPLCAHLSTPRQIAAIDSYPWECPECKVCVVCKSAGDEATLMICDDCDRGWHTGCCTPKVAEVPEGSWLCALCAECHGCGGKEIEDVKNAAKYRHAVAPSTERHKFPVYLATFCNKCHRHFDEDRFCPVCLKTYSGEDDGGNNEEEDNDMVCCDLCDRWIHTGCDERLTPERYQKLVDNPKAKYQCPLCEDRVKATVQSSAAVLALKGQLAPCGYCIGVIGGKVNTRGIAEYKGKKVGVPEINGTGITAMP